MQEIQIDVGLIPGSRRSPGEQQGNPLQDSWLGNPRDRGAWWATAPGFSESDTTEHNRTKQQHSRCQKFAGIREMLGNKILICQ